MDEDVTGVPGHAGGEDAVMAFQLLADRNDVLKSQDVVQAGEVKAPPHHRDAEAALEGALGHAEAIGGGGTDQEQLADLIRRDGNRATRLVQLVGEAERGVDGVGRGGVPFAGDTRGHVGTLSLLRQS